MKDEDLLITREDEEKALREAVRLGYPLRKTVGDRRARYTGRVDFEANEWREGG